MWNSIPTSTKMLAPDCDPALQGWRIAIRLKRRSRIIFVGGV